MPVELAECTLDNAIQDVENAVACLSQLKSTSRALSLSLLPSPRTTSQLLADPSHVGIDGVDAFDLTGELTLIDWWYGAQEIIVGAKMPCSDREEQNTEMLIQLKQTTDAFHSALCSSTAASRTNWFYRPDWLENYEGKTAYFTKRRCISKLSVTWPNCLAGS